MSLRLLPSGMAARFALLLAAALIAANMVALALLSQERERLGRDAREMREVERVISLIPALEAVAPDRRERIARSASTRFTRIDLADAPLVVATAADARSRAVARRVEAALPGRMVHVAILDRNWRRPMDHDDDTPDGRLRGETIAMSVELAGEGPRGWLNVASANLRREPDDAAGRAFILILGLSLLAVLAVGLWFLRRLTQPLKDLAQAARAAGMGDRSIRLAETGPRELRAAAAAFNDMQARIARFDAERMRTLAAVGHDLRTPITSLRIRAEMVEDEDERDAMVRTLDEMTVMADGLVAYARGEDGEQTAEVALHEALQDLARTRGATVGSIAEAVVRGRPVALRRAIGNLIDNALRYGGAARVALAVEKGQALVTVEDNGPGIPEERMQAMFDPFVRGEESRNADTGGAGLGLSIARGVVIAHGGTIRLENRAEGGLRALVTLPLARG